MHHRLACACLSAGIVAAVGSTGYTACCYFAPRDRDITQPAQRAFITYDVERREESFTVQPRFEGNAADFGMVIPTPSRPKLDEMPRDFFAELSVFTILEPLDGQKFGQTRGNFGAGGGRGAGGMDGMARPKATVRELEAGTVGSLDYKIIAADRAEDLFEWLKLNKYSYSGDQATLDFYVKKKWLFTVMKVDPTQMKRRSDGSYEGQITPTRFTFSSEKCVYPLKITQISVKDKTEAMFYVQTSHKVDLPGDLSYKFTFVPMCVGAFLGLEPSKLTRDEADVVSLVGRRPEAIFESYLQKQQTLHRMSHQPATLEWAKKITAGDIAVLAGTQKFNRTAPAEDIDKLKILKGHITEGQFITKYHKVFDKTEMEDDLIFVPAAIEGKPDKVEYYSIWPTSP